MPVGYLQARKGVRLQGPLVDLIVAANASGLPLFQLSQFAAQVGTRTFRIKRIKGINLAGLTLCSISAPVLRGQLLM